MKQIIVWHLVENPLAILSAWLNILRYNFYRFPTTELLRHLFSPWRRYTWSYGRGFSFSRYAEVFFSNMLSRFIGATLRAVVIALSLLSAILIVFLGLVSVIAWILLPFLGLFLLAVGIILL